MRSDLNLRLYFINTGLHVVWRGGWKEWSWKVIPEVGKVNWNSKNVIEVRKCWVDWSWKCWNHLKLKLKWCFPTSKTIFQFENKSPILTKISNFSKSFSIFPTALSNYMLAQKRLLRLKSLFQNHFFIWYIKATRHEHVIMATVYYK